MNKKETQKLVSLVKRFTQADAVFNFLSQGYEFTVADAQAAGIADPRRVVNHLRNAGAPIYANERKTKTGVTYKSYRLGTPRKNG